MTPLERLAVLPPAARDAAIAALPAGTAAEVLTWWEAFAHDGQRPVHDDWRVWLIRAGRGFGKTRAGSEWVNHVARSVPGARIALVGATAEEARRVMVEGPSGVLATARLDARPEWGVTKGEVRWPGGAVATVYSADAPEGLRGPEHHAAWCDELAKWRRGDAAWDNLMMTMRLGDRPRVVVTTTPRPNALMRRVMALPGLLETRGGTAANVHLPAAFVAVMHESYGGTALGRQELDGEMIEAVAGALWSRGLIEGCRVAAVPSLVRVVVGVDPPAGVGGDACGIVAVGLGADTAAFARDVNEMRAMLEGPFEAGVDRAGRAIETTLSRALRTGTLGFEDLRKVALSVLGEIAASAMRSGIEAILGGGRAAGPAGLLGALLGAVGAPGRAIGGPVSPGRPFWVGERGPELFVPTAAGSVVPNGAGAAREVRVSITVNAAAESAPAALARSSRQVARAVRAALAEVE